MKTSLLIICCSLVCCTVAPFKATDSKGREITSLGGSFLVKYASRHSKAIDGTLVLSDNITGNDETTVVNVIGNTALAKQTAKTLNQATSSFR